MSGRITSAGDLAEVIPWDQGALESDRRSWRELEDDVSTTTQSAAEVSGNENLASVVRRQEVLIASLLGRCQILEDQYLTNQQRLAEFEQAHAEATARGASFEAKLLAVQAAADADGRMVEGSYQETRVLCERLQRELNSLKAKAAAASVEEAGPPSREAPGREAPSQEVRRSPRTSQKVVEAIQDSQRASPPSVSQREMQAKLTEGSQRFTTESQRSLSPSRASIRARATACKSKSLLSKKSPTATPAQAAPPSPRGSKAAPSSPRMSKVSQDSPGGSTQRMSPASPVKRPSMMVNPVIPPSAGKQNSKSWSESRQSITRAASADRVRPAQRAIERSPKEAKNASMQQMEVVTLSSFDSKSPKKPQSARTSLNLSRQEPKSGQKSPPQTACARGAMSRGTPRQPQSYTPARVDPLLADQSASKAERLRSNAATEPSGKQADEFTMQEVQPCQPWRTGPPLYKGRTTSCMSTPREAEEGSATSGAFTNAGWSPLDVNPAAPSADSAYFRGSSPNRTEGVAHGTPASQSSFRRPCAEMPVQPQVLCAEPQMSGYASPAAGGHSSPAAGGHASPAVGGSSTPAAGGFALTHKVVRPPPPVSGGPFNHRSVSCSTMPVGSAVAMISSTPPCSPGYTAAVASTSYTAAIASPNLAGNSPKAYELPPTPEVVQSAEDLQVSTARSPDVLTSQQVTVRPPQQITAQSSQCRVMPAPDFQIRRSPMPVSVGVDANQAVITRMVSRQASLNVDIATAQGAKGALLSPRDGSLSPRGGGSVSMRISPSLGGATRWG